MVTGKDSNPLNEVELICDSLMNNDGLATLWALRTGFSLRDQDRHSRR
jgi:hypothetical protein